jgi:hypothetical protein
MQLEHFVTIKSHLPVNWLEVRYPGETNTIRKVLQGDAGFSRDVSRLLPPSTPITQPYWLREPGTIGLFRVDNASLIGQPENPPVFPMELIFEVGGEKLVISTEPMLVIHDRMKGEVQTPLRVVSPVSLRFLDDVELFPPGAPRSAVVEVTTTRTNVDVMMLNPADPSKSFTVPAVRSNITGTLRLEVPPNWRVTPPTQPFSVSTLGESARLTFNITAPATAGTAEILAVANVGSVDWHTGRVELKYDHIPPQLLQPPARLKALSLELVIRGRKVGYVPGAGDDVAAALARMGFDVTTLAGADLTPEKLRGLDAVVTGVRAFNVRTDLAPHLGALFDFATNGGNVIVLYNRPQGNQPMTPFSLTISSERVTDFTAAMTLLEPEHPAFNTPNKIVPADFDGWVQERGAYFPSQWDPHFTPLLACHDPGEQPLKGSLLVAQCGKGNFVYTALSWFRQLPDGVPGAYRLFANLVSLGK